MQLLAIPLLVYLCLIQLTFANAISLSLRTTSLSIPDSLSRYRPPTSQNCVLAIPAGTIHGALIDGGCRYTIKYGASTRWGESYLDLNSFFDIQSNGKYSASELPPSCPQVPGSYADAKIQSEDCLYAVVYTPPKITFTDRLSVFVWIHGGSFMSGSASAPGLVGSKLAVEGGMTVVVVQYRLGVLGFLPPASLASYSDPNLGLKDVILALGAIQKYISHLGGDAMKVTIGGQSSGAGMIRALWASPAAKGLFRGAILQSDPMSYGLASPNITAALIEAYYSHPSLSKHCKEEDLLSIPVADLIKAQLEVVQSAALSIPRIAFAEPIRPTYNTPSIPLEPSSTLNTAPNLLAMPPSALPLLVTTTANEAGSVTQSLFPEPVPVPRANETYLQTLNLLVGPERARVIVNSSYYALPSNSTASGDDDSFRKTFERLVTDGEWRCANRYMARKWAEGGGKVWVGEWTKRVGYVSNAAGYCAKKDRGMVCHEDDIFPTFGTTPSPSAADIALHKEVSTAWISFIHNLDPNTQKAESLPILSDIPKSEGESLPAEANGTAADRGGHDIDQSCSSKRRRHTGPPSHLQPGTVTVPNDQWEPCTASSSGTSEVRAIGGGKVVACPEGFWGHTVPFDWQLYG